MTDFLHRRTEKEDLSETSILSETYPVTRMDVPRVSCPGEIKVRTDAVAQLALVAREMGVHGSTNALSKMHRILEMQDESAEVSILLLSLID